MAVTIALYNNAAKRLVNKELTFTTLRVMLLDNTATFLASDATLNAVAGVGHTKEIFGFGWAQGGVTLANVAVTVVTTNDAKFTADNVSVTASGGLIGTAFNAVLYDDSDVSDAPLAFIAFGAGFAAGDGTAFVINWSPNGIFPFVYAG